MALRPGKVTHGWALAVILVLALVLRVIQLDFQPLWWDEGYSVFFATRDLATMLARTAIDIHPPLYYAIMQGWIALFGSGSLALRALSVLIGVAAIPLLYTTARELFNPRVAIVSAFLLAIAPLHIYYSQELRMYGLVTLLGLASVTLQLQVLSRHGPSSSPRQPRSAAPGIFFWVGYILTSAALLYVQYFAVFLIIAEIVVVLYLKSRANWKLALHSWLLAWLAIAALYLPWAIYAGPKLFEYVTTKVGIEQYSRLDPFSYLVQHLTAFSTGHVTEWTWLAWGTLLFVGLAVLGFFASRSYEVGEGNSQFAIRNVITAIYLLVPLALGFLVNLVYTFHPIRYERLLLFVVPFFLIYVACGIVAFFERERALGLAAAGAVTALCALSLFDFYTVPRYAEEDYRPLVQEMASVAQENDLVYALYPWQIGYLESYYRGAPLNIYEVDGNRWVQDPQVLNQELTALREANLRAWLLAYQKQGRILEDRLTNAYSNDYVILDETFGDTRLAYFAQGSATDFELVPLNFAPDLTLRLQYAAFEPPAQPQFALARFGWNAGSSNYAYSLRLVDSSGAKVAQQDAEIPEGAQTVRRALALPANLAPGEYHLQLVVYRRSDQQPLAAPTGGNALELNTLTISP